MKIAVQIFGHLRTFKECFPFLEKNLLDKYDCDVFMHTWDTIDHSTKTWHNNFMPNTNDNVELIKEDLISLYKIKKLKIEHQNPVNLGVINAIGKDISIYGMRCMFHSMKQANKLREEYQIETGEKYDFVITLRPDLQMLEDFSFEHYLERMTEEEINKSFFTYFFPMIGLWNDLKKIGASDILFFARPNVISNIFANFDYLIDKIKPITINFGPEAYFLELVESLEYNVKLIKYAQNTEFLIKRPNSKDSIKKNKNIKIKISLKNINIFLFRNLNFQLISFKLHLFNNSFNLRFSIGRNGNEF